MTSQLGTSSVGVHSGLVAHKVLIDSEGSGDRTVLEDVLHHLLLTGERVGGISLVLVRSIRDGVSLLRAGRYTSRGGSTAGHGGGVNTRDTIAVLEIVRKARFVVSFTIVTTGHDSLGSKPLPSHTRLATIATLGKAREETAARDGILGREKGLESSIGGNAESVIESLSGGEGPARSTVSLVTDGTNDVLAGRESLSGVKGVRKGSIADQVGDDLSLVGEGDELVSRVGTAQLLGVGDVLIGESSVHSCSPSRVDGVDLMDHVHVNGRLEGSGHGNGGKKKGSLHDLYRTRMQK
jgi:hypothetical protein